MKEELISFETSKLAKDKGFDVPVRYGVYGVKMKLTENYGSSRNPRQIDINWNSKNKQQVRSQATSVPTQSLLQKWLREVHRINVESYRLPNIDLYRCLFIPMDLPKPDTYKTVNEAYISRKEYLSKERHETYEQALEAGLLEALKLIKL